MPEVSSAGSSTGTITRRDRLGGALRNRLGGALRNRLGGALRNRLGGALTPGGVLQQWVQLHHISPREIACDLATARAVFRHVGLWFYGNQEMLVASDRPPEINTGHNRWIEYATPRYQSSSFDWMAFSLRFFSGDR